MNGYLNVLKPPGMTSHDVVNFIRKSTGIKKVGHTGTLDPEATGVLPICVGKATKSVQYIVDAKKIYRVNIKFGIKTDTQDKYGKILGRTIVPDITFNDMDVLKGNYIGRIQQIPPLYSAVKHNGKRLYRYAYEGKNPVIKSREIEIYDIIIIDKISRDEFMLDIICSKGTYIRTLCNDMGEKLGHGAFMSQLIRLESHPFNIDGAYTLEEIKKASENNNLEKFLVDLDYVFLGYIKVSIKETAKKLALNGNPIPYFGIKEDIQTLAVKSNLRLYINNEFIGIGEIYFDDINKKKNVKIKTLFV